MDFEALIMQYVPSSIEALFERNFSSRRNNYKSDSLKDKTRKECGPRITSCLS